VTIQNGRKCALLFTVKATNGSGHSEPGDSFFFLKAAVVWFFEVFFILKYIKIIFFIYFFKFVLNIITSKQSKNIKK
jgi:hypothetical protein